MPNNWDGQISAKGFYEFMKKISELGKSNDDFSKVAFKIWDNNDRKSQNPSYPDYTISFKLGDGSTGAWSSTISIWKSKPKDNTTNNNLNGIDDLISDNVDNTDSNKNEKIDPNDLPF